MSRSWHLGSRFFFRLVFLPKLGVAEGTIPAKGRASFWMKLGCCAERNTRFVGPARQQIRRKPKVCAEDLLPEWREPGTLSPMRFMHFMQ